MKRLLWNALVAACASLAALALVEGIARLCLSDSAEPQYGGYYLLDGTPLSNKAWAERFLVKSTVKDVRHGFVPNGQWKFCYPHGRQPYFESGGCVVYEVGSHGYREPEGSWFKPPGVLRVLVIGDSVTFGVGVPSDSAYSRHLETWLQQRRSGTDVVNLGVLGYTAGEMAAILVRQGLERGPDVVIWQLHINDLIAMEGWRPPPVSLSLPQAWSGRFALIQMVERRLSITRHVEALSRDYGRDATPLVTDDRTADFLRAVTRMGTILKQCHLPCIAMLYPYPDYLGGSYPFMGLHDLCAARCREEGLIPLDLLPVLKPIPKAKLWVDLSDNHPSARAHRVIAATLVETLSDHFGPGLESLQPR